MPVAPLRPCPTPTCHNLTRGRRCVDCTAKEEQRRGTAAARGYAARWQRYRASFLRAHPLCAQCQREGFVRAATVVDHITPHRGDQRLFWDRTNHQPLCKEHHDVKTSSEGSFEGGGSKSLRP